MLSLKAIVGEVRRALIAELGDHLRALYLFGPTAQGRYVPGRSDVDLLLVVDPAMPLIAARNAFRPLWEQFADVLGRGPLVATPDDLALHLELSPALHRALLSQALRFHGDPLLRGLPSPPPPDPLEEAAEVAAHAITYATTLTPDALPPDQLKRQTILLDRLARRFTPVASPDLLTPLQAIVSIHARLQTLSIEMPRFAWRGAPPPGPVPDLLPGCLAFYQWEKFLIVVLERVDAATLAGVDWGEVSAAAEEAYARFALATPWQLRLAAIRVWPDALFFRGFEHLWGADILGDLSPDEPILLRQLTRVGSEQVVESIPTAYLTIPDEAVSKLIHDTQNVLLNAGLRAELFTRFTGRDLALPDWTPPGRDVPQPERVQASWERWREVTGCYARLWRETKGEAAR